MNSTDITSLYVHVPFCAQKCSYCAFFSEASSGELIQRYVQALGRELELVADSLRPRTIFFGGGTPSILNLRQWEFLLETMHRLKLTGAEEWTVECNPATVSLDKARLLRSYGVNRISMGVQSLDENLLDRLGRIHSREMVFKSYDILRAAGFENINVDLMFAIPGQTMAIWQSTLTEAVALGSEHLSSYEVIYEEDTPLYERLHAQEFDVDEDLACDMYEELIARSGAAGFRQYEIANFAKHRPVADPTADKEAAAEESGMTRILPSQACQHNVNYWRGGQYHGLGPSAAGYVGGVRTKNWSNTEMYCSRLEQGQRAVETTEQLEPLARAAETAAFGLRMNIGWPFQQFRRITGWDMRPEWSVEMDQLITRGWGRADADRFQLTPAGLRFADAAAEMFLR